MLTPASAAAPARGVGVLNELWCYVPQSREWSLVSPPNSTFAPQARAYHSAVVVAGVLVVFGGASQLDADGLPDLAAGLLNSVDIWDPVTGAWSRATPTGPAPSPRAQHSAVAYGDKMLIFGGVTAEVRVPSRCCAACCRRLRDRHRAAAARCVRAQQTPPAAANAQQSLPDVWLFDVRESTWERMATFDERVLSFGQQSVRIGSNVILFGGTFTLFSDDSVRLFQPGCGLGYVSEDFATVPCTPCPAGTYADEMGLPECRPCPVDTYTPTSGSTSIENCTICAPGTCHHGQCRLGNDGPVVCTCDVGYLSIDRCTIPYVWIIVVGCIVVTAIFLVPFVLWRRSVRLKAQQEESIGLLNRRYQSLYEENQQTWRIPHEDVSYVRRLDDVQGWAEVWLGNYIGKQVVIKKLPQKHVIEETPFKEKFEEEIRIMKRLRHTHIVYFYGVGTDVNGAPFFVIDYMSRGSLDRILADSSVALMLAQRVKFALDAAKGMRFLHSQRPQCIHRDLKSPNLLVGENWLVKVADFGTAKLLAEIRDRTSYRPTNGQAASAADAWADEHLADNDTLIDGTPPWQAPELMQAATDCGAEVDVYSFGIVMWELLTRRKPFESMADAEMREAILRGERYARACASSAMRRTL